MYHIEYRPWHIILISEKTVGRYTYTDTLQLYQNLLFYCDEHNLLLYIAGRYTKYTQ